jgi:N-acetylglucosaminyl-diphospho-decaprenol L-rhamnosyltransferase
VRTSVIIVNWNAGGALRACLESLAGDPSAEREVILVDNASTDGSLATARSDHPALVVVETGSNLGFAAGANRGAARARGDVLVFLNPDARVEPGAVERLTAALDGDTAAGIAGGGLIDDAGRWQPAAAHFRPVAHLLCDTTPGRLAARRRRAPYAVDWVYGTFMAARREIFARLGGFDERYFLYGEDLDLCYRARACGVRTVHVPAARAAHGANLSARARFGPAREAEVVMGELRFYAWRRGAGEVRCYRVLATLKFGVRAALAAALGRRGAAASYGAVVRACWEFNPRCDET